MRFSRVVPVRLVPALSLLFGSALFGVGVTPAQAQTSFERVSPASAGFSPEGLDRVTARLQAHVDAGDVAGVVAAVLSEGKLVYAEAVGVRDLGAGDPLPFDALFRMYSMTRPVTSLAILMLAEEGRLQLEDPVWKFLPEFRDQAVLEDAADPTRVRARQGEVTLAHLLTHTSGIGSRSSRLYEDHAVHRWDRTLAAVVEGVARLPLYEDPGTAYRYGMHAEVLGRVIEVVSGVDLDAFLRARIFEPLGMHSTHFRVLEEDRGRLATLYRRGPAGALAPFELETHPVTEPRTLVSGGVGLVSTAEDFLRFSQFFLDEGRVGGVPLVRPETIELARANAIPPQLLPLPGAGYWAGSGWSLGGFAVVLDPAAYPHPISRDVFWWDGSAGTRFWIDPHLDLVAIVLAQISPAGGNGFREGFIQAVYAALDAGPAPRDP
jgi:CubicO group peptidase (beta-lactamase class C family)